MPEDDFIDPDEGRDLAARLGATILSYRYVDPLFRFAQKKGGERLRPILLGLSVAGVTYQGLLRNPLADPYVLGVSGGAATGALLAMLFGLGTLWLHGAAFGGALLSMLLVFALACVLVDFSHVDQSLAAFPDAEGGACTRVVVEVPHGYAAGLVTDRDARYRQRRNQQGRGGASLQGAQGHEDVIDRLRARADELAVGPPLEVFQRLLGLFVDSRWPLGRGTRRLWHRAWRGGSPAH